MKSQVYEPHLKAKKRITPVFVGQLTKHSTHPIITKHKSISNAEKRVLQKSQDLEDYYQGKKDIDEYPEYGF